MAVRTSDTDGRTLNTGMVRRGVGAQNPMAETGTQVTVCTVTSGAKGGDSEGAGENPLSWKKSWVFRAKEPPVCLFYQECVKCTCR